MTGRPDYMKGMSKEKMKPVDLTVPVRESGSAEIENTRSPKEKANGNEIIIELV